MKKTMVVFLFCFAFSQLLGAIEVKTVNELNYASSVAATGVFPVDYIRIPFGEGEDQVGGYKQDPENFTDGVPFGIIPLKDGSVWILDTINQKCKKFSSQGKLISSISFKEHHEDKMGVVRDFTHDSGKGFYLACTTHEKIERIDEAGKLVNEINGLPGLWEMATDAKGNVIASDFSLNSTVKFDPQGKLIEEFDGELKLSVYTDFEGNPYGLRTEKDSVIVFKMTTSSPGKESQVAKIPLPGKDLSFSGTKILGTDSPGNLYLELTSIDDEGVIHNYQIVKVSAAGKILSQTEIKPSVYVTTEIPRALIVTPEGKLMGFHADEKDFIISTYAIP